MVNINDLKPNATMQDIQSGITDWSEVTFPDQTCKSLILHLGLEYMELVSTLPYHEQQSIFDTIMEVAIYPQLSFRKSPRTLQEEVADMQIIMLALAGHECIDLASQTLAKMITNLSRRWERHQRYDIDIHAPEDQE